ncbi:uncharacterized protein LOC144425854 [Styela clava]
MADPDNILSPQMMQQCILMAQKKVSKQYFQKPIFFISGCKINMNKCQALYLGGNNHCQIFPTQDRELQWNPSCLGINVGGNDDDISTVNLLPKLQKMKVVAQI